MKRILCLFGLCLCSLQAASEYVDRFVNTIGVEMQFVPGGPMESLSYKTRGLSMEVKPLYVARYEVTVGQFLLYLADLKSNPLKHESIQLNGTWPNLVDHPSSSMGTMSVQEAISFCKWLSKKEKRKYRLLNELEWEYIARAGTVTSYWWGREMIHGLSVYRGDTKNSIGYLFAPAGVYPANQWGFYNVYGAAAEWSKRAKGLGYTLRGGNHLTDAMTNSSLHNGYNYKSYPGGLRLALDIGDGKEFLAEPDVGVKAVPENLVYPMRDDQIQIPIAENVGLTLLPVQPGTFTMGAPETDREAAWWEGKPTTVTITYPFALSQYEITQQQMRAIWDKSQHLSVYSILQPIKKEDQIKYDKVKPYKYTFHYSEDDFPANNVSWEQARIFTFLLTYHERLAGRLDEDEEYRLPFEWEWEYCARSGTNTRFHFGDDPADLSYFAWFDRIDGIHPVGEKLPNQWGFYDMHGNVQEWTANFISNYRGGKHEDPFDYRLYQEKRSTLATLKGGAWNYGWRGCRASAKSGLLIYHVNLPWVGFRVVKGPIAKNYNKIDEVIAKLPRVIVTGTDLREPLATGHFHDGLISVLWDSRVGTGGTEESFATVLGKDGSMLVAGSSEYVSRMPEITNTYGDNDYFVAKLDAVGKAQWLQHYGGTREDVCRVVKACKDGGYFIAGTSSSPRGGNKQSPLSGSFYDMWLLRIDGEGAKLWEKTIGGLRQTECRDMIILDDGSYVLAGNVNDNRGNDLSHDAGDRRDNDMWAIKFDQAGNKMWDVRLGGNEEDNCTRIIACPDGGFLLGGDSISHKSGDISQSCMGKEDFLVFKIDAQGQKQWDRRYGGIDEDMLADMTVAPDGGYVLTGTSRSAAIGEAPRVFPNEHANFLAIKINEAGEVIWEKQYGGFGDEDCCSVITSERGYVLAGSSNTQQIEGDKTESSRGQWDYWLLTIDKDGNKIQDKCLGSLAEERCAKMIDLGDHKVLLTGTIFPTAWEMPYADVTGHGPLNSKTQDIWSIAVDVEDMFKSEIGSQDSNP